MTKKTSVYEIPRMPKEQAGSYPYTRGIYPEMYRKRLWTMRQYAGFGSAQDTNQRFHKLLQQGQTGLSIAFDLPTQMGLDSDHPLARPEVGRVGVAIDSIQDMEELLQGIPLQKISLSMTINAPAIIFFAMLDVIAEKQDVPLEQLRGTMQNDMLKEFVTRGTYIFPIQPSLRLSVDLISHIVQKCPYFHPLSVGGYHMREAGCTAIQELSFTFAHALVYLEMIKQTGLSIDQLSSRMSFFFASHQNFIEEVAKFRAARKVWARLMRENYKASEERSWQLRFHTQTAGSTLTEQQPYNNIIRITCQALAAILGGTQSLHTNSWDEAHSIPSEKSALLALRTQQILAFESGLTEFIDPLAGAEIVEQMTQRIEQQTWRTVRWIQYFGGAVPFIQKGTFQRAIRKEAYYAQMKQDSGEEKWVGVNCFQEENLPKTVTPIMNSYIADKQVHKLRRLRENRDNNHVAKILRTIEQVAGSSQSLYQPIVQAVKNDVTVGEICQALKNVWGEERSF